jgi:hypothetical protein
MIKDAHMEEVFPEPPMVAYRQAKNTSLKSLLVKSKLPANTREKRKKAGMKRCNQPKCQVCPYVEETKTVKSNSSNFTINIKSEVNCNSENVIYYIYCDKDRCKSVQYIGETGRRFSDRCKEHLGYVRNTNLNQPTGVHFNLQDHSIANMKVVVIEQCVDSSTIYRRLRESYLINKFKTTLLDGLNQRR